MSDREKVLAVGPFYGFLAASHPRLIAGSASGKIYSVSSGVANRCRAEILLFGSQGDYRRRRKKAAGVAQLVER